MEDSCYFSGVNAKGIIHLRQYAEEEDINFWLVAARRPIVNPEYASICDEFMRYSNTDVNAIGKILASLPPKRGIRLLRTINSFLPELCQTI